MTKEDRRALFVTIFRDGDRAAVNERYLLQFVGHRFQAHTKLAPTSFVVIVAPMANLTIRNIPVDLYRLFKARAAAHNRNWGEEVIAAWQAVVLVGKDTNRRNQTAGNRKENRFSDREGNSEQQD